MKHRVLVLTAGFGEGHNAAARNLAAALDADAGPGTARIVDLFALVSPRLNEVSRRGYISLINRAPKLWSAIYAWIDRTAILPAGLWLFRKETRLLATLIEQEQPTAICSAYPVYGFMLEKLAGQGIGSAIPRFTIVTDSISINSLWWRAGCTGWFVPNEDSAEVMRAAGVEAAKIFTFGFPTPAYIASHAHLSPPRLDASTRGSPAASGSPRVLYIINSGSKGAELTARLLLAEQDWEITFTVGRNEALRASLEQMAKGRRLPATILGWTDQIPHLLLTHHVVVSKAGGATTQEAIAARCPLIVNQVVPGQEEGNYELLRRHGVGARADTATEVVAACRRAFANQGQVWQDWRNALDSLSRPDAAKLIAQHVLRAAAQGVRPGAAPLAAAASPSSTMIARPRPVTAP